VDTPLPMAARSPLPLNPVAVPKIHPIIHGPMKPLTVAPITYVRSVRECECVSLSRMRVPLIFRARGRIRRRHLIDAACKLADLFRIDLLLRQDLFLFRNHPLPRRRRRCSQPEFRVMQLLLHAQAPSMLLPRRRGRRRIHTLPAPESGHCRHAAAAAASSTT
jgi:hypothetical protein